MIQLRSDCLVFKTKDGDQIPCSAELVTLELMGEFASQVDPNIIQNAAAAVLHYFKTERQQDFVSVAEFADALEKVLRGFGLNVLPDSAELEVGPAPSSVKVVQTSPHSTKPKGHCVVGLVLEGDLRQVAVEAGKGCELFFFPHLRDELKRKLDQAPNVVHFRGLRACVKQLTGAQRWSQRCQTLSDQIVEYLRTCLSAEPTKRNCALVVF